MLDLLNNPLTTTLIGLALVGLSFLAYWEPLAYRKIHNFLWVGLMVAMILYFTFEMGVIHGRSLMAPYIDYAKFGYSPIRSPLAFGTLWWMYVALNIYLAFLRGLGPMVGRAPRESGIFIGVVEGEKESEKPKVNDD